VALSELTAATGQEASPTTAHSIGFPIGYSEGDVLVLIFTVSSGTDTATTPADWTLQEKGTPSAGGGYVYVYTRAAPAPSGGPTPVFLITTSITEQSSYVCLGFADGEIDSFVAQNNGASSTSIVPSSYSGAASDAIYGSYAVYGNTDATPSITVYPSDHGSTQIDQAQSNMGLTVATSGVRASAPSSQTFTQDSSTPYRAGGFVVTEVLATPATELETIDYVVAVNPIPSVVLEKIEFSATINPFGVEPTTLERIEYSVSLETQIGAVRLVNGIINTIKPQPGSNSLTLLPPRSLAINDTWGALLQGDMPSGTAISFDRERRASRKDLATITLDTDGDYVRFRYDGEAIFVDHSLPTESGAAAASSAMADFTLDGININQALAPVALTSGTLDSGWSNSSGDISYTGSPSVIEIAVNIHGAIDNASNIQRPASIVELWRGSTLLATYATGYIRDATDHEEASWSGYFIDRSPGTNPSYQIRTRSETTQLGAVTTQDPSTVVFRAVS
jgi:hypothetical protein